MTDQIERLFADLRAETIPSVRPPGIEPLRRAARRRRAVVASAAAVVVLAVAGLATIVNSAGPKSVPAAVPAPSGPVYSTTFFQETLAEILGGDDRQREFGRIYDTLSGEPIVSRRELLGGTYQMLVTCYGSGSVGLTLSTAAPWSSVTTLPCETTQVPVPIALTVPGDNGTVGLEITPHGAGAGQAAFGYRLKLSDADRARYQDTAQSLLPEFDLSRRQSFFMEDGDGSDDRTLEPGRYRIWAACVGFGGAVLTVGEASDEGTPTNVESQAVRCTESGGEPVKIVYDLTTKGLSTQLTPDEEAAGRAAGAILVERDR